MQHLRHLDAGADLHAPDFSGLRRDWCRLDLDRTGRQWCITVSQNTAQYSCGVSARRSGLRAPGHSATGGDIWERIKDLRSMSGNAWWLVELGVTDQECRLQM